MKYSLLLVMLQMSVLASGISAMSSVRGKQKLPPVPTPSSYNASVPFMSIKQHGYTLSGDRSSPNRMDFFIDPFCEESALGAWPTVLNLSDHYEKTAPGLLEIRVHLFPLAYTFGSFQTSQAIVAVYKLSGLKDANFFKALSHIWRNPPFGIFGYQDTFANMSKPEMSQFLADDLLPLFPSVSRTDFLREMNTQHLHFEETDLKASYWLTKAAWKYATTKGVFGTPTYFLNDVFIPEIGQSVHSQLAWQPSEWWQKQVLDPSIHGI